MPHTPNTPKKFASRIAHHASPVVGQTRSREQDFSHNKQWPLPNESEFACGSGLAHELSRSPGKHDPRVKSTPVGARSRANSLKVLYLLTTFPLLSETFVRREVRALSHLSVDLDIYSLWGGETTFEFHKVSLFPKRKLFSLLWWTPYWMVVKPRAFTQLAKDVFKKMPGSLTDFAATLLGISFAICHARH